MLLCVQAVTTKGHPKLEETREAFRLEAVLHIQKPTLRSVQIYEFGSCYMQQT